MQEEEEEEDNERDKNARVHEKTWLLWMAVADSADMALRERERRGKERTVYSEKAFE